MHERTPDSISPRMGAKLIRVTRVCTFSGHVNSENISVAEAVHHVYGNDGCRTCVAEIERSFGRH